MKRLFTLIICSTIAAGSNAYAKKPLLEYPVISQGLFDMAVANEIGKRCSSISTRKVKGLDFARSLFSYAKGEGYSYSEVKTFIKDKGEKAKLRKRVIPYLKSEGVDIDAPQSFCPLGQREIKKKSQIGVLLKG